MPNVLEDETEQISTAFFRAPLVQYFFLFILLIVLAYLVLHNLNGQPDKPPVGTHVIAMPAPPVKGIPKVSLTPKSGAVRVYESRAKIKLDLPAEIAKDDNQQVIESTQVKADDHPQTVTTIINAETGETQTLVRRDPLPWLAWDYRGSIGAYTGLKNGEPAVRVEAKQNLFQTKAVHVGVVASVDQRASGQQDYFVGVGAEYRW